MTEPVIFGFSAATSAPNDYPFEFIGHYVVGGNPETEETGGYWDTEEQAILNFALQFAKLSAHAQGGFLFVRRAPVVSEDAVFEGNVKWRMIGRFSIAKLKEKNI